MSLRYNSLTFPRSKFSKLSLVSCIHLDWNKSKYMACNQNENGTYILIFTNCHVITSINFSIASEQICRRSAVQWIQNMLDESQFQLPMLVGILTINYRFKWSKRTEREVSVYKGERGDTGSSPPVTCISSVSCVYNDVQQLLHVRGSNFTWNTGRW